LKKLKFATKLYTKTLPLGGAIVRLRLKFRIYADKKSKAACRFKRLRNTLGNLQSLAKILRPSLNTPPYPPLSLLSVLILIGRAFPRIVNVKVTLQVGVNANILKIN